MQTSRPDTILPADVPFGESRRVVFRRFGGPEVLELETRPIPVPDDGQVRVRVLAAGVNPVDWKLFSGKPMRDPYERHLPSGNGYDFSGIIDSVGVGVTGWAPGDAVFGGLRYEAQADHLIVDPAQLARVPAGLDLIEAGALNVVGRTAHAAVVSQQIQYGETVLVSGAAGGVGFLTAQLCVAAGARVIGTASRTWHDQLAAAGIHPVEYGPDLITRLRTLAPQGIDAALDTVGHGTVETALALGVDDRRINTIADYDAREKYGVAGVGGAAAGVAELEEIGQRIAAGELTLPISATFGLEDVRCAYRASIQGHVHGKIVITTGPSWPTAP
ncbi:NADP-dependent oxidoreductase [Arthrobacter sp. RCC_34]|uniref:NADP-dependent oxidoreductase n=1 Tax=Arthrobacter sp. RCC_34 TaxID=3239230 RepID=UPI003525C194